MGLKIPVFKTVNPDYLLALQKDLKELVSEDSLTAILNSYLAKIKNKEKLEIHEIQFLLDWHSKIESRELISVRAYLGDELSKNSETFKLVAEFFSGLTNSDVLQLLMEIPFIHERLEEEQGNAFGLFLSGSMVPEQMTGTEVMDYIENLYLVESEQFTKGQRTQAEQFLFVTDFSKAFETDFEHLVRFISNCGTEFPGACAKILDRQLGRLIDGSEAEVTAKAYNNKLGYLKYKGFVESKSSLLSLSGLPNYQKLLRLISRFEEAVNVLSEHEIIRGTFWKSIMGQIDGVKFHTVNYSEYRVGVAFFVGKFVFCDFGPTGNKIHIFDAKIFAESVEKTKNWKKKDLLTSSLSTNLYSHIGDWQSQTRKLINEARRNG